MKVIPLLLAVTVGFLGNGCIHIERQQASTPAPVTVVPATGDDSATLAEIQAASKLDFDSGRLESLSAIARRPNLSPTVQVSLVNTAYKSLDFDSAKVSLL